MVRNKMKKNKWYEPYKVVTTLDLTETARRIESKIMLKFAWSIENYLFYGKKFGNGEYRVYISPREMSPRGNSNPFLPKVIIEIIANPEGKSTVYFHLKSIKMVWICILTFFTFGAVVESLNISIYVFFLCIGFFLRMKYWKFVRRRVGEWVEELLDVKKETEE